MGRVIKYTGIDRVLSKLYRDLGLEEISETDVIEWAGEALEFTNTPTVYEKAVTFLEVKNFRAEIPNGLHSIIQIARNIEYTGEKIKKVCPIDLCLECEDICLEDEEYICDECNKDICPDEMVNEISYFTYAGQINKLLNSLFYRNKFQHVRLSNHTFFNRLVCPEDPEIYRNISGYDEYGVEGDTLKFSFPEGQIAISYYKQKIDKETGYPMIPDDVSVVNAITYYITWKFMQRMYFSGREGYAEKMQYAEKQWGWYCKQSVNKSMMPHGVDEHQNLLEERYKMLPDRNAYYKYFGKIGKS